MSHSKYREENDCLNCRQEVTGRFCSNCGQENIEVHENFGHMVGHFISDYFHFDNKFFRSLIPLFFKPGFLTKEYWEGRRVRYIHPLRLFFFVTIIFMISTSYFYSKFGDDLKSRLVHLDRDLAELDTATLSGLPAASKIYLPYRKDSVTVKVVKEEWIRDHRQVGKIRAGVDLVFKNLKYVTFLLLPLYALIFKLLYLRRRPFFVDHLVYTMHLQTFAYCLFSVTLVLPFVMPLDIEIMRQISVTILLIYIAISLHKLYRQVWWKTGIKTLMATFWLVFTTSFAIMLLAIADAIFLE